MARKYYLFLLFILILTVPAFAGTEAEILGLQREIADKQSQLAEVQSEIRQPAAAQPRPADRLNQLQQQQEQLNRQITGLKADLLDRSLKEPVWAEGAGAAVLDPGATMGDCQQAALDRALQDAEANAASLLIAAISQVEPDPAVRDRIKASLRFKLLEQDGSGDFGKALPAVQGETVKYAARVRAKIQCDQYSNPYRPVQCQQAMITYVGIIKPNSGLRPLSCSPPRGRVTDTFAVQRLLETSV